MIRFSGPRPPGLRLRVGEAAARRLLLMLGGRVTALDFSVKAQDSRHAAGLTTEREPSYRGENGLRRPSAGQFVVRSIRPTREAWRADQHRASRMKEKCSGRASEYPRAKVMGLTAPRWW